jgi:hypothetical protein
MFATLSPLAAFGVFGILILAIVILAGIVLARVLS